MCCIQSEPHPLLKNAYVYHLPKFKHRKTETTYQYITLNKKVCRRLSLILTNYTKV